MKRKIKVHLIAVEIALVTIAIICAYLLIGKPSVKLKLVSEVNKYEAVVKAQYLKDKQKNPTIPNYFSYCGDSKLSISMGSMKFSPDLSSTKFQIFREQNNLIVIGVKCSNPDKEQDGGLFIMKYNLDTGKLVGSMLVDASGSDFKAIVENNKLVVFVVGEDIRKLGIDISTLQSTTTAIVSAEEYRAVNQADYIPDKQITSVTMDNGVSLNPEIGEAEIEFLSIPEVN